MPCDPVETSPPSFMMGGCCGARCDLGGVAIDAWLLEKTGAHTGFLSNCAGCFDFFSETNPGGPDWNGLISGPVNLSSGGPNFPMAIDDDPLTLVFGRCGSGGAGVHMCTQDPQEHVVEVSAGFYDGTGLWYLSFLIEADASRGSVSVLWIGTKSSGETPAGTYARFGGCATGPAEMTFNMVP